ncbi:alpha/beta hydrolase [Gryllotalpicola ginsengisoli]|uniref:alpha/beta hydrolase n=1 Tax=Gryllotalpicola ginsengisoli TaxID=444608 RepID=UPI001FDF5AC2|nr:alpha/beta hydrolase [Gryllotalpicola ginsengisoli]
MSRRSGSRRAPFPVGPWLWTAMMAPFTPVQSRWLNAQPLTTVRYELDIDYVGEGHRGQHLDVLTPRSAAEGGESLPVYVYFHGGGWTSGDKAALTKYCAVQADTGIVVVNVNYRTAGLLRGGFHMRHMLHDANDALRWVAAHIADFGGDPGTIVLGGDSAGAQIAALYAAMTTRPELADHYGLRTAITRRELGGLVLHCGAVDFSVVFEPGFIMSHDFVRMLLPGYRRARMKPVALQRASRWLSPIEWLDENYPPALVTTSERDIFYQANLNFVRAAEAKGVPVELLSYEWSSKNTEHTWQQYAGHPESQEVYSRLQRFIAEVNSRARSAGA